ncbi:MAG: protease inhibitor I42 family protein [Chloroflexi bacterium]|nr:protease inhibitor I42 family protein [Chloroflexota bacterium]
MNRSRGWWLFGVLLALALVACGPRARAPLKVVERDSGAMIELRVGEQIELVLDANPSTGYNWEVAGEVKVVKLVGEPQFTPDSKALGAGGKMTMRFQTVAPGEEWLRVVYRRSWEEGVAPEKMFELYIVVK